MQDNIRPHNLFESQRCLSCNGLGYFKWIDYGLIKEKCKHCKGTGRVSWVDVILGKLGDPTIYEHTKWIEEHYFEDKAA